MSEFQKQHIPLDWKFATVLSAIVSAQSHKSDGNSDTAPNEIFHHTTAY